jgi:Ca2+-binding RTX toxin-like protein
MIAAEAIAPGAAKPPGERIVKSPVSPRQTGNCAGTVGSARENGAGDAAMATVIGTIFSDWLEGTDSGDSIHGFGGDDGLKGGGGADRLDGGAGIDTAYYTDSWTGVTVNLDTRRGHHGTAEGDTLYNIENLYGSYFNDALIGTEAANAFYGLDGNDTLISGGGTDTLNGGTGDDTLKGGGGADHLIGGSGIDTADYSQSPLADPLGPTGVWVTLSPNPGRWGDAEGDTLSGIENITGSAYNDLLVGDTGANVLRGMNGHDTLQGAGGDDRLYGGDGRDHLDGGPGSDTMVGGTGDDSYSVHDASDVVIESGGQGSDAVWTAVSYALTPGADVETLRTSENGTAALNLTGNASGNIIRGNNGNNVINGGDGNDELTGFGGQDSFLFDTPLSAAFNVDVVTDFDVADDTIVLNQAVFGGIGLGTVAGSQFAVGPAASDANHRIIYDDASGAVYYDSDGTGATTAVQFAQLGAGLALTNSDFYVNYYF